MGPNILSIKYGGHDTAAALMKNGELVAACAQERYSLDKHSRRFPDDAIADCLKICGLTINDVNHIAFVGDVYYYIREMYLRPALENHARIGFMLNDIERVKRYYRMEEIIREHTGYNGEIGFYRHHLCHLASAYFPSGFSEALLVSYDGGAEKETGMLGTGRNGKIGVFYEATSYPHAFGLLYAAITFYLGWKDHCDEGIVMGLAPYGDPYSLIPGTKTTYSEIFADILQETGDYDYQVNTDWTAYYEMRDTWVSKKFIDTFGPRRLPGNAISEHHKNIAAALQERLEVVVLNQLRRAREETGLNKLCFAGGVALNCALNGRIARSGLFEEIFVQPASSDDGTTIGACYLAQQQLSGTVQPQKNHNSYKGSRFVNEEIHAAMERSGLSFILPKNLYAHVAQKISEGKIVGWFQGEAEFGPRALGNRSILARPFPAEMKDHINARVKFREYFRPFAPAVLDTYANEYFELGQESPHMLIACKIREEKRNDIAAVVHVDGTCRVQTVNKQNNLKFWSLLEAFHGLSGIPVLLNTSFNVKGQPIVNTPSQAIDCFKNTNLDCLVLGDYFVEKHS